MTYAIPMHPALTEIAVGADHLLTDELARVLRRASQTIRKAYSLTGHYLGIRPVKLGNRLLWPKMDVNEALSGGVK